MIRLFINNVQADIWSDDKMNLSISYAISEMRKLSTRKGTTTKTIQIPATPTNRKLLGFQDIPSNTTVMNNQLIPARIEDGSTIFIEGHLKFISANQTAYQIVIIGDNGDWATQFKQKSINELDYSDQTHTYDESSIVDSWTVASGRTYTYPFIDYGNKSGTDKILRVEDFRPAIQVGDLIQRMYNELGFTLISTFNTNVLSNYYLPFINERLVKPNSFIQANQWTATNSSTQAIGWSAYSNSESFINIDSITVDSGIAYIYNGTAIASKTVAKMKVKIEIDITNTASGTNTFQVLFRKNTVGYDGGVVYYSSSNSITLAPSERGVLSLTTKNYLDYKLASPVVSGADLIYFAIRKTQVASAAILINSVNISNEVIPDLLEGQDVIFEDNLPDINQLEFISDIKTLFNLYFRTNFQNKTVYIEPKDDFYKELSEAVDWTSKRDLGKGISIEYLNENLPKKLTYSYSEDGDDGLVKKLNEDNQYILGESSYTFANVFSTDEGTTEIKTFAPTYMNTNDVNGDQIDRYGFRAICPVMWRGEGGNGIIPDFKTKFKPRILYYKGLTNTATGQTFNFEGTARSGYPQCYYYNDIEDNDNNLMFGDLTTGFGLMNKYYLNENSTLDEGKIVTMYFNLSNSDINLLDMSKPVKVKNDYYYINKISDYSPLGGDTTAVELITIIETTRTVDEAIPRGTINNKALTGSGSNSGTSSVGYDAYGNLNIYTQTGVSALTVDAVTGLIKTNGGSEGMFTEVGGLLQPLYTIINGVAVRMITKT